MQYLYNHHERAVACFTDNKIKLKVLHAHDRSGQIEMNLFTF